MSEREDVGTKRGAAAHPPSDPAAPPPGAETVEGVVGAREEVLQLEMDLALAHKRVDELARAFQSLTQDREEFKLRLTRERERMIDVEKGNVAVSLLEAIDDLDLCLSASAQEVSPLAQGVRMIRDNLLSKLTSTGIERFTVVGQPYDPNVAEAGDMEVTVDASMDQQVVAEMRAGYRLKGRVIRPARVKVARYLPPAQA